MKVIIHTMTPTSYGNLGPAPSIRDWDYMSKVFETDTTPHFKEPAEFIGEPLDILTTYRGNTIYLAGGISFNRINPSTLGGNGMITMPVNNVTEKCSMMWNGVNYNIDAEFIM